MPQTLTATGEQEPVVLRNVVARHAVEAAFLWHLRDAAARSVAYTLDDLRKLDDRLDANIDGLVVAGETGQEICAAELADADAGEVFAAVAVAVQRGDTKAFVDVLARSVASRARIRGLVSGIGWAPLDRARGFLTELLAGDAPRELYYSGIAGCAAHRFDPGPALREAVLADDLRLKARALRAVGELGRADLLSDVRREIGAADEGCHLWAAWSAALLGDAAAHEALWALARAGGPSSERACDMAVRRGDLAAARVRLRELGEAPDRLRVALGGAAALSDPVLVPWLIERMAAPEHARFAGWAFTMITGAGLAAQKLEGPRPEGFSAGPTDDPSDDRVAMDPDHRLPFPDVAAVRVWWDRHGPEWPPGKRLLLGKPLEPAWLGRVLRFGSQPARQAAAIELSLSRPGKPLFAIRAPGFRQLQALASGT